MLPGLIWFAPLQTKSPCPHTRDADFVPDGNSKIRLLPLSLTNTLPAASTLTSTGE